MSGATVPQKAHAELGASVASRWLACPGSVALSRQVPKPASTTYADEGTRAHAVAELSLTKGLPPDTFVGMEIEGGVVTEDMADFVAVFVNRCRALRELCEPGEYWTERRFNLAALNPPGPMYGTADHVAYARLERTLYVDDLKFGAGVVVEVLSNTQLRYYGLGAALSFDPVQFPIDKVVLTIVQPRAGHRDGPVRSEEISYVDLLDFAGELMAAAKAALAPNARRVPGNHCRFCPASGVCPEQRDRALAVAQSEFDVVSAQGYLPPAPETIPPEQFVEMLGKLHILEDWAAAMRATAFGRLERGEPVPGWKLVAKRATRKWADEDAVVAALEAQSLAEDEIYKRDLKSPAQIEKVLGKKPFAAALEPLVVKQSSGYKMAPESDPAPAVSVTRGEEFAVLMSGEE